MRWLTAFSLAAFSTLAVLPSCSHKDDPLAAKLSTVEGFCDEWGARACNDTVVMFCSAKNKAACVDSQRTFCESLIPDGKYSEKTARDCLGAVEDAYRDGILTATERDTVTKLENQCDKVVSGSGTEGKSCAADSDCDRDEDLSCIKKMSSLGKCEMPSDKPIEGGHKCDAAEAVCADGFYCDGSNCLAVQSEGDDCSPTVPCESDSRCLDADDNVVGTGADGGATMGICRKRKAAGNACATDDDCITRICAPRAGSTEGVCTSQVLLSPSDPICNNLQ